MVELDASYFTAPVCHGLEERGVAGVMGYRRPPIGTVIFTNGNMSTTKRVTAIVALKECS